MTKPIDDFAHDVNDDSARVDEAEAAIERMQALEKAQTAEIQQVAELLVQKSTEDTA